MKRTVSIFLLATLTNAGAMAEVVNVPPPGQIILPGNASPAPGNSAPAAPAKNKPVNECADFRVFPGDLVDVGYDVQVVKYKTNKPQCIKMLATDDEWVSVNRTEVGFNVTLEENTLEIARLANISIAGTFSGETTVTIKQRAKGQIGLKIKEPVKKIGS